MTPRIAGKRAGLESPTSLVAEPPRVQNATCDWLG
jgi:hypothetical protein